MLLLLLYLLFVIVIMLLGILELHFPPLRRICTRLLIFFFCRYIVDGTTSTLVVGRCGRQTNRRYDESFNNEFKIRGILF